MTMCSNGLDATVRLSHRRAPGVCCYVVIRKGGRPPAATTISTCLLAGVRVCLLLDDDHRIAWARGRSRAQKRRKKEPLASEIVGAAGRHIVLKRPLFFAATALSIPLASTIRFGASLREWPSPGTRLGTSSPGEGRTKAAVRNDSRDRPGLRRKNVPGSEFGKWSRDVGGSASVGQSPRSIAAVGKQCVAEQDLLADAAKEGAPRSGWAALCVRRRAPESELGTRRLQPDHLVVGMSTSSTGKPKAGSATARTTAFPRLPRFRTRSNVRIAKIDEKSQES